MWYRLIGGGLLLLCAGVWARDRTSAQRADVMRIAALCDLLVHVGEQVATYCMPLDEIAATLPTDLAQACDLCAEGLIPTLAAASERIADGEAAADEEAPKEKKHLSRKVKKGIAIRGKESQDANRPEAI